MSLTRVSGLPRRPRWPRRWPVRAFVFAETGIGETKMRVTGAGLTVARALDVLAAPPAEGQQGAEVLASVKGRGGTRWAISSMAN